ncbi:MAG TPA: hypothetical protein VM030_02910 [Acidimicrobiales bacterium]|nr:hypothetical protein [Acidimicrobiales bacterium]
MALRPRLDTDTADRLLSGAVRPEDAPPGLQDVAGLVADARAVPAETAVPAALVAGLVQTIQGTPVPARTLQRTPSMLARILRPKTAMAAIAAVLFSASAAAAGSGSFPEPAQDGIADVARHVGIDLPDSDDEARDAAERDAAKAARDKAKAERKAAHDADKADDDGDDTATDTADDNESNDHGKAVSDVARNDDAEGREHGENVSTVARSGHGGGSDADDKADHDDADDEGDADDDGPDADDDGDDADDDGPDDDDDADDRGGRRDH